MDFIWKWCSDTRLCHFIKNHVKPVRDYKDRNIFRVAQEDQLRTKKSDGTFDGMTTMVHNGIEQDGLSPIWYTTEEGGQFYLNDEARQQKGYIIRAKMIYDGEQGYFLNFADEHGRLNFEAINSFINFTGVKRLLNGIVPFNTPNRTRISHLYTDVLMFRYFINLLNELDHLFNCDDGNYPEYPIYGFYLGKSDSNMTLYTENAFVYYPEYIIIQRYQKDLLLIEGIEPLQTKRSREETVYEDDIYLDISTSNQTPLNKKSRKSVKSNVTKPTTTKKSTKKRGGSKRKGKTRRKKRTYK